MSRAEALERYRELSLPSTSEESWRFTDLRGFDPDAYSANGAHAPSAGESMLDIDAAAIAEVTESGVEVRRTPDGVTFEPLGEHERLGELVGVEDKLTAHNAAAWKHGLLVRVPAGMEIEKPLYVRVGSSKDGGALLWRLLVVAEEGSRFSLIEEAAS
ncbi:MAG: hypothetical protein ACRDGE_12745, partial [Candidatus Limnocylindria bacterium]